MNAEHERYATWDAAYALGALSTAERAEYERHLADCQRCRDAAAELAPTVALLSRLGAEEAERATDAGDAGPVRVLAAARNRRRARRRIGAWAAGIAAAVVVATVVSVSALSPRPAAQIALEPVDGAPVTASVAMSTVPWGTKLDVQCEYDGTARYGATGAYALAVIDVDGHSTMLSNWTVTPGATARLSAGTALRKSDIRAIEIRDADGRVMVRHEFG
ncbi:zf-HC2 domain-containing protein [Microbacterium sp. NPDC089318]